MHATGAVLAAVALVALCACNDDAKTGDDRPAPAKEPAAQVAVFDGPYCDAARHWAVRELDGSADGAYASGGPTALRVWWDEQLEHLAGQVELAPAEIRAAETLNERDLRTRLTPLLEKYGFDFERFDQEASAEEKARADRTPRPVAKAQEDRDVFQNRECGYGGSPPPAEVTFTGGPEAKAYCKAVRAQLRGLQPVIESGFDPAAFRAYVTSESFLGALDAQDAAAPSEIAADVLADNQWVRAEKLPVLDHYEYDLRRVLLEGTAAELRTFNYWDPEIIEQDSRVAAFVSQVCGLS
jgi:hypothetical protein